MPMNNDARWRRTQERKALVLELVSQGYAVMEALADPRIGVTYSAYRQWRRFDAPFAARMDTIRYEMPSAAKGKTPSDLTSAEFAKLYFNRDRTFFQQMWVDKFHSMRAGDILMALWPPEYGKTSTYEDVATEMIARDCNVRLSVASENSKIAQKILGAVRHRLEPGGPTPRLVKEFGPFRPDKGTGAFSMPWNNEEFSVFAKRFSDERDFSMQALGRDSSFVSLRTDWLHVDDPQSTKTLGATQKIIDWFRQDGLARPGESGKTTISMTRVGPDDFAEVLENDEDLHGILHVLKFKAILTDVTTGEQRPLWPEKHTLEQLERMRLKMGQERFDRNYMMDPGASMKNRTFTDDAIAKACNPQRALRELPASVLAGDGRTPAYITLDPALGVGRCSFGVFVPTWEQLLLVDISEEQQFQRNEDIMGHLEMLLYRYSETLRVTDVVIEAMNFQRGLARNSQLLAMRDKWGFQIREHLTGMNKYDENIGIASMAGDFSTGKVELPYAPDATTRSCIDEVISQAKKWKPGARGNKLRQDRLMVIWFAWILWEQRRLAMRPHDDKNLSWKRKGVPWGRTNVGVIIPIGAKL